MIIDQLESRFEQLAISPEDAQVLLALPLVAVLSVDQKIKERELEELEAFCRQRLAFAPSQLDQLHAWCASPPNHEYIEEAHQVLEALHLARNVITVENRALEKVLIRAEKMLRNRVLQSATPVIQGQQLLECFCHRFGIDLGMPWQNLMPESAIENQNPARESGIRERDSTVRTHGPSEPFPRDSSPGRGPAF